MEEVEGLLANGYSLDQESFKAVGYREMVQYLRGEIPREDAINLTKRNTRHFARRQLTWFRSLEDVEWIPLQEGSDLTKISQEIEKKISAYDL